VLGGEVTGVEELPRLTGLQSLKLFPPDGGQNLSFLGDCPALDSVHLYNCTELVDLSALVSASGLAHVHLGTATRLRRLRAFRRLADLRGLGIGSASLSGGLDAVTPILDRLKYLGVWSAPTVTSLNVLAGSILEEFTLCSCPVLDLEPLVTVLSLEWVWLGDLSAVNLAPLAMLPKLRDLHLMEMREPIDLSPLAQIDHRLRVYLRDTATVGDPGPLVKIRKL